MNFLPKPSWAGAAGGGWRRERYQFNSSDIGSDLPLPRRGVLSGKSPRTCRRWRLFFVQRETGAFYLQSRRLNPSAFCGRSSFLAKPSCGGDRSALAQRLLPLIAAPAYDHRFHELTSASAQSTWRWPASTRRESAPPRPAKSSRRYYFHL